MNIQYPEIPGLDRDDQDSLRQLNSSDEKIRFITLMNIAEEEREELLPWLYHALQYDPAALVRTEAAKRLEGWENKATLQALAAALTDDAQEVIDAATQSLSEIKYSASATVLAPYLAVDNIDVKVAILRALKPLRAVEFYQQIQQHTQHEDIVVRREAVSALSWLQQQQAVDILADIAQHDVDLATRRIATGGLAYSKQNTASVIAALQASLISKDWQLRVEAALTTGKLQVLQLQKLLIELLADTYWQVRIAAVRGLGLLKANDALSGLADNFNHHMSNLRKEVALALGEIGGQQAEQLLLLHQHDLDPEVRKAIRISLNQIRGRTYAT